MLRQSTGTPQVLGHLRIGKRWPGNPISPQKRGKYTPTANNGGEASPLSYSTQGVHLAPVAAGGLCSTSPSPIRAGFSVKPR